MRGANKQHIPAEHILKITYWGSILNLVPRKPRKGQMSYDRNAFPSSQKLIHAIVCDNRKKSRFYFICWPSQVIDIRIGAKLIRAITNLMARSCENVLN